MQEAAILIFLILSVTTEHATVCPAVMLHVETPADLCASAGSMRQRLSLRQSGISLRATLLITEIDKPSERCLGSLEINVELWV